MAKYVDLSEKVTATYYDEQYEEWTQQTVTIADVLDSVCDEYTSVDAEPVRHGHWVFGNTLGHSWMKCSECLVSQNGQTATYTYCPDCGAKMDEVEQDE